MSLKQQRRRGTELEEAILDAAWEVLTEQAYSGFTYEAVAARAGTSRPVLYRRWPQRGDLLLATLRKFWIAQPVPVPDTGSLRDDAIGYLRNAVAGRSRMITLLSVQLTDYFRETGTSFSDLRETLGVPGRKTGAAMIVERAVERGELPAGRRSARVVNLPFDLLRHDMLMTLRPVPDEAIVEIVDEVWLPLLTGRAAGTTPSR
ncbi:TetR/AcrR family transcriptional regulator [Paractinoplanes toevensis]|uniref:TetR family transcriptional regulator n=1 Tax=Paractinoplanes toevensis TaxID=571911 RepID=A0A919VYP7_9ACTN|nr:TetR/AcrR family transcriptional regulator [Actinoplanes toevensis]GIM89252.1 TetR family transcriptional regulator [Actinoplanes toevensis]